MLIQDYVIFGSDIMLQSLLFIRFITFSIQINGY